jgi:hypothetical protein
MLGRVSGKAKRPTSERWAAWLGLGLYAGSSMYESGGVGIGSDML